MTILCSALCVSIVAKNEKFKNFDVARDDVFWPVLYKFGGETVYCGLEFKEDKNNLLSLTLSIEHAVPQSWIVKRYGCKKCGDCTDSECGFAIGDLHNLWPVIAKVNSSRRNFSFGEIPGEKDRRFTRFCSDYERTKGSNAVIEPREAVKGDLARSVLYMLATYDMELPSDMDEEMLSRWHRCDPPDKLEMQRNNAIEKLQGNRNPYIDQQGLQCEG